MALDINGYNDTFRAFVDFAQAKDPANEMNAVARGRLGEDGALAGHQITASDTDGLHQLIRSAADKTANDRTREIFKNAIIEMFGGEAKIPASVKKAMMLGDYGCGRPLTARRILCVKDAIDANGAMRRRAYNGTTYLAKVDYIKGLINGKGGLDGAAKQSALDFFDVKIRNTIDFLDQEFDGLSYAKVGGDNAAFKKYIKDKTGLDVDVEKIFSDLKAKNAIKDPVGHGGVINIDDINNVHDEFFEPAKQKIGELLKTLVKKSVDLFIEAMESKDGEGRKSVIDAISKEDGDVSEILFSLDSKIVEAPDCLGRDCPNMV